MKNPKVSVIIPVYNIEEYLPKCLDSLCTQTFEEIEIIVVNDASSDNSQRIIDHYCGQDSRIRPIVNSRNLGLFLSRLEGLKWVRGQYVTFVDGDDYIEASTYEVMHEKAVTGEFDIVACRINRLAGGHVNREFLKNVIVNEVIYDSDILRNLLMEKISNSVWNKLYKIEIIQHVVGDDLFKKMRKNVETKRLKPVIEDQLFNFFATYFAKSYFMVDDGFYNYIHRENSISNAKDIGNRHEWFKSAMHNFYIVEELLMREGMHAGFIDELEEMKKRLVVKRKRRVLTLFPPEIRNSPELFAQTVEDLTQYVPMEYLLKHIVDAAQLEILQLRQDNDALVLGKRERPERIEKRAQTAADVLGLPKKIIQKIKGKIV